MKECKKCKYFKPHRSFILTLWGILKTEAYYRFAKCGHKLAKREERLGPVSYCSIMRLPSCECKEEGLLFEERK